MKNTPSFWRMRIGPLCTKSNAMNRLYCPRMMSLLAGVTLVLSMSAQPDRSEGPIGRDDVRERMEAMVVGFLTEKLELNAEQAQVFWPIFNAHKETKRVTERQEREARKALGSFDGESADEFSALLDALEAAEIKNAQIRAAFLREVSEAFDPDFAVRCVRTQKEFERMMREQLQGRMSPEDRRALGKMGRGPGRKQRR